MNQSDKLFPLIKSLTPPEKRYFTLFSKRHQGGGKRNKYRILFDIINSLASYDEEEIKTRIKKRRLRGDLPSLKTELYEQILRSMREYRSEKSVSVILQNMLEDLNFLRQKGLYEQCWQLLERAEKMARDKEEYWALVRLYDTERQLAYDTTVSDLRETMTIVNRKKSGVLNKLLNLYRTQKLYDSVFVHVRINPHNPAEATVQELAEIIQHPLLNSPERARSFGAKSYFYNAHLHYNQLTGNLGKAFDYHEKLLALWEKHPHQIQKEPQRYMKALSNCAGLCLRMKLFSTFEETLKKIDKTAARSFDDEAERFQNSAHLRLLYLINTGTFTANEELLRHIDEGMEKYKRKINVARRLAMYYNLAILFFITGKFNDSLRQVLAIIEHRKAGVRRDILVFAHLLLPVLHYELGNNDIIHGLIRDANRYLQKNEQQQLRTFEDNLLKFLRKQPTITKASARKAAREAMKKEIDTLIRTGTVKPGLHELSCWLESKLTRRRMADICRDRMR
jgi:tetratricopeptide (TPR) repeat protein